MRPIHYLLLILVGSALFYYRDSIGPGSRALLDKGRHEVSDFNERHRTLTPKEEEVKGVLAMFQSLFTQGDPRSEAVYLPGAVIRYTEIDASGQRKEKQMTGVEHKRLGAAQVLPLIRAHQPRFEFSDVRIREAEGGQVRVKFTCRMDAGPPEAVTMTFVKTAPTLWAVVEETHLTDQRSRPE